MSNYSANLCRITVTIINRFSTIITNLSEKGFACKNRCSYCNWITHPLLEDARILNSDRLANMIKRTKNNFITISGGGDPLFNYHNNPEPLDMLIDIIHSNNKHVRIITREIDNIRLLKNKNLLFSISLDRTIDPSFVNRMIPSHSVEYSDVLADNKLTPELIEYYINEQKSMNGSYLTLRENLNEEPISNEDLSLFSTLNKDKTIRIVRSENCLSGHYQVGNNEYTGYELGMDMNSFYKSIIESNHSLNLIGSFLRHKIFKTYAGFNDIDIVVTDDDYINELKSDDRFKVVESTYKGMSEPRYFHALNKINNIKLHIIKLTEHSVADYVYGSQLNIDRVFYNTKTKNLHSWQHIDFISRSIKCKRAVHLGDVMSNNSIFARSDNRQLGLLYLAKMLKKGWTIKNNVNHSIVNLIEDLNE